MNNNLAKSLKLDIHKENKTTTILASGQCVGSSEFVELFFHAFSLPDMVFSAKFLLLPNLHNKTILGIYCLYRNEVKLNPEDNYIEIISRKICISQNISIKIEKDTIKRLKNIKTEFISKSRDTNPKIGKIKQ